MQPIFHFLGVPVICGGYKHPLLFQDCFAIGQDLTSQVDFKMELLKQRAAASSVILSNQSTLWIVGGYDADFERLNSTEFVKLNEPPVSGPVLPTLPI